MINNMLFNLVLFFIFSAFFFYFPGKAFLDITHNKVEDFISEVTVAYVTGISFFLLSTYTLSWIHASYLYYLVVIGAVLFEGIGLKKKVRPISHLRLNISILQIIFILLGSTTMAYLTWSSGTYLQNELVFYGVNHVDGVVHISIINQFVNHFPPFSPNLSNVPFRGYHFFFDFLSASIKVLTLNYFTTYDLFFRFTQLLIIILYGLTGLFLAKRLSMNKVEMTFFLGLLYFIQGTKFLFEFIFHFRIGSYDPPIVQGIENIIDPSTIFAFVIFFTFAAYISRTSQKIPTVLAGLLLGILPVAKIYIAILAYLGIGTISLLAALKYKDYKYLQTLIFGLIISALVYLPLNFGAGELIFSPLLIYRHFIEGLPAISFYQWGLKYQIFVSHNNIPRIIILYIFAIICLYIPTLGIRMISIMQVKKLFSRSFYTNTMHIFWLVCIVASFLIPTFFVQSVSIFNSVQFIWMGYILLLIPTATALGKVWGKNKVILRGALLLALLIFTLPDLFIVLNGYMKHPTFIDSSFIKTNKKIGTLATPNDAIIVIVREKGGDLYPAPLVAALSGRQVYYEPSSLYSELGYEVEPKRLLVIDTISKMIDSCKVNKQYIENVAYKERLKFMLLLKKSPCVPFPIVDSHGDYTLYRL